MGSPEAPHFVPQPRFLFFLRIAQLVLSVIVLGLTAFAMSQLANFFMNGSFGYAIFCSIYSLVGIGYILIAETMFINIWQRYVVLLLDVFGVIFWISAWGALAAWAAIKDVSVNALSHYNRRDAFPKKDSSSDYTYTSSDYTNDYYDLLRGSSSYPGKYNLQAQMAAWRCIAAAAALGALIW
jgi:hypothetical protein